MSYSAQLLIFLDTHVLVPHNCYSEFEHEFTHVLLDRKYLFLHFKHIEYYSLELTKSYSRQLEMLTGMHLVFAVLNTYPLEHSIHVK